MSAFRGKSYPLNTAQPYPFEQWWIAAYSGEITRRPLQRTILDRPLVFYRTEGGEAVALAGLCPHRLYPLVKGRLQNDAIQCGYHGFTYDKTGRCIHIPSQDRVPPKFGVRRYPSIERGGVIWVWTGDTLADSSRLSNLHSIGLDGPGWTVEHHPLTTVKARYQLLIDNLLDLSHISFVHAMSIPGGGSVVHIPVEIVDSAGSLNVRRIGRGLPNNPYLKFLFPEHDGPVDQDFDAEYLGPHLIRTGGAIHASGAVDPSAPRELGVTNFLHGITPETPSSVHYFVMTARNFRAADPAIGAANIHMGTLIQPEDVAVIESIECNVDRFADTRRELSCAADAGAIAVRRRLAAQIRAERQERAAAAPIAN